MNHFKFQSVFGLNILVITFLLFIAIITKMFIFGIIAFIFLMILPNCSIKN